jgi:uncharacterized RDD family membrane protein YckC
MDSILKELISLGILAFISMRVWFYYRRRTYPVSERYSTFGPRFCSGFVDGCVLWPVGFAIVLLYELELPVAVVAVLMAANNLAWLVYTIWMHGKRGQTVGKMVCKVQVVDHATEQSISYRQACIREGIPMVLSVGLISYDIYVFYTENVAAASGMPVDERNSTAFWLLASLPLLWYFAEVITMLTNEKRRALHDFLAGTVVVRTNTAEEVTVSP